MRTNTEINTWEIKDNKYNLEGKARPKSWEQTDRIASVSNVDLSDKEWDNLANSYTANDLVKVKVGEEEIIVNGTDLIVAIENALHSSREAYSRDGGRRRF